MIKGTLVFAESEIEYEIFYSRRKTLAIHMQEDGRAVIKAPLGLTEDEVHGFVEAKKKWLYEKHQLLKNRYEQVKRHSYCAGEEFLVQGQAYQLLVEKTVSANEGLVLLADDKLIVCCQSGAADLVRGYLKRWYFDRALKVIETRIKHFAPLIGCPSKVIVKEQQKRWGSCSSRGEIRLNWKLIMAPEAILDYVIVHELAHLVQMNHSREFWHLVEGIIMDYKERREWLKDNGYRLEL